MQQTKGKGNAKGGRAKARVHGFKDFWVLGRARARARTRARAAAAMGSDDAVAQDEAWAQLGDLKRERVTWIVCCLVATHMDDL